MGVNHTDKNQSWYARNSDELWGYFWMIVIGGGILLWILFGIVIPWIQYSTANPVEQCKMDIEKLDDNDKYCDSEGQIQSYAEKEKARQAAAEEARKANLTPKQRCEEEHTGFSDPDSGEYYSVTCKDDGTYEYSSLTEIYEDAQSEYYDGLADENYDSGNNCDPNYTPCVPNVSYDLDCPDIGFSVRIIGSDPHRFDRDGDGYGCESY